MKDNANSVNSLTILFLVHIILLEYFISFHIVLNANLIELDFFKPVYPVTSTSLTSLACKYIGTTSWWLFQTNVEYEHK